MKYKRHLNPKCDRFFQRPQRTFNVNSHIWYYNIPLGHNTLGNMMSRIPEKAGLSHRYTNHSTLVHTLDSTGLFAGRHIMCITGHRAESSLKTYSVQTEPEIKRRMSDKISKTLRAETCVKEVKEGDQLPENLSTNFDVSEVELKVSSNS